MFADLIDVFIRKLRLSNRISGKMKRKQPEDTFLLSVLSLNEEFQFMRFQIVHLRARSNVLSSCYAKSPRHRTYFDYKNVAVGNAHYN